MQARCRIICCRLYDGLLILIFFAVENALDYCRCPWLRWRQCHSLSAIMGQLKHTRPTYSNPKHLLAFLTCLLVLYSRSRGRWRWPELSYYNIWNSVTFHWSISAASTISWDSPACFLKPNPDPLMPWWNSLLQEIGRWWTKIHVCAAPPSFRGSISAAGCKHKPLVFVGVTFFINLPILLCIYSLEKILNFRKNNLYNCVFILRNIQTERMNNGWRDRWRDEQTCNKST